ncbi:Diacylglycerol O-acyltransferase [Oopsacas minuta]|uniref:Diacylglycerol O-acyltransferase n=1 Tax=Oopsacas minuta TaxID=111878 RepID=A0AAV7JJ52_9METZ|nr:Diacylglycerol O-acyltransferase [Oopsacas minuta]
MNIVLLYGIYVLLYIPIEVVFLVLLLNFLIYNIIVFAINKYYFFSQKEARLNASPYSKVVNYQDNFFNWIETPLNLSYNCMTVKMKGRFNVENFKTDLSDKIFSGFDENNEALFPKFRQVIKKGILFSTWEYTGEFNVEDHVKEQSLDFSVQGSVENFICEISKYEINKDKPQWAIYLITDPKVQDVSYLAWRVHHSLGDGFSMWRVIFKICDINLKDEFAGNKLTVSRLTTFQRIMANMKTFLSIPMYLTDLIIFTTKYNRKYTEGITNEKRIAWSNKLDFEKVRDVKSKTKTTVNDVLMTLVTESTRRYFTSRSRNDIIDKEVIYGMGVSLDADIDNLQLTNNDAGILILTPTIIEGPFNQLKIINRNMAKMKYELWPFFYSMCLYFLITLPIPVSLVRKITGAMAIGIGNYSNVPGPNTKLVWNGVVVDEAYAIVMTSWNQVLAIVFSTYKGKMCLGVKSDCCIMDKPDELVEEMIRVLEEMYLEVNGSS